MSPEIREQLAKERSAGIAAIERQNKKILELEQRVKVLTDVLQRTSKSLGAFCGDEGWGMEDMNTMDAVDAVLAATPQQTAAQIERWHVEWMMKLTPVFARKHPDGDFMQSLYAIPQLQESKE